MALLEPKRRMELGETALDFFPDGLLDYPQIWPLADDMLMCWEGNLFLAAL
ncbi:MAG TPA: hypothetical protein VE988_26120 [Gemmataceae bacterium]|nr:hypothetical protein [Gemmataceae bacterium]